MCNLYSLTKGQQAIIAATRAMIDSAGNLPLLPGIFPDYQAPIVRTNAAGARELVRARWGMPSPAFALAGKTLDKASPACGTRPARTGADGWGRRPGA